MRKRKSSSGRTVLIVICLIAAVVIVGLCTWFGLWREYMVMTKVYGWSPSIAETIIWVEGIFSVVITAFYLSVQIFFRR